MSCNLAYLENDFPNISLLSPKEVLEVLLEYLKNHKDPTYTGDAGDAGDARDLSYIYDTGYNNLVIVYMRDWYSLNQRSIKLDIRHHLFERLINNREGFLSKYSNDRNF